MTTEQAKLLLLLSFMFHTASGSTPAEGAVNNPSGVRKPARAGEGT